MITTLTPHSPLLLFHEVKTEEGYSARHISLVRCCADIVQTYVSRDICLHYFLLRFSPHEKAGVAKVGLKLLTYYRIQMTWHPEGTLVKVSQWGKLWLIDATHLKINFNARWMQCIHEGSRGGREHGCLQPGY